MATSVGISWKLTSDQILLRAELIASSCRITNRLLLVACCVVSIFRLGIRRQSSFVSCRGEVFDVAVDLRKDSPTYGKWESVVLSAENKRQFFIPRGFAHGFLVLSDTAEFCYKCDDVYHPNDEGGIMWNDPSIGIEWPPLNGDAEFDPAKVILSDKDKLHPSFAEIKR